MIQHILVALIKIILGFGGGIFIAGGMVAFISIIGVIPIMAYRSKTASSLLVYENMVILGTILGGIYSIYPIKLPYSLSLSILFFFAFGLFVGTLIIALAEVLSVLPILDRTIKIKKGITLIIFAIAFGKLAGSLCYWLSPYFGEIISGQ